MRTSSGVGSRSTRSEDEVFADAVTDFADNVGPEDASSVVMERGNSLQSITENDDGTKHIVENSFANSLSGPIILPEDNQPQTFQTVEGEKEKVEASMSSQDHISSSTFKLASVTIGNYNNAVERNMMQSSKSGEVDIVAKEAKEILLSEDPVELGTSSTETAEEASDKILGLNGIKPRMTQTNGFEDEIESSHELAQVIDVANGNTSNASDVLEECDTKIQANEHVYILALPDALPLRQHPEIDVEDLDHKGGKLNISMAPVSTLAIWSVEQSKASVTEESWSSIDFTKPGESNNVHSIEIKDMLKEEVGQSKSIVEQDTVGEPDQMSDVMPSSAYISEFKTEVAKDVEKETCEDEKLCNTETVFPEGGITDGGDNQETSSNTCAHESDGVDNIASRVEEEINTHESNDMGQNEKVRVEDIALKGKEMGIGEEKNESVRIFEAESGQGSTIIGSHRNNEDTCTEKLAENACGAIEGDRLTKHDVGVSGVDILADSSSQTDSLEGNWGSVSVLSAITDSLPATDAATVSNASQSSVEAGSVGLEPKVVEEGQHSKSKTSDKPLGVEQMEGVSEIPTSVVQEKRDEEIIAKVTNWSTETQHAPLKTRLVESIDIENSTPMPRTGEIPLTNSGSSAKTENVILSSEDAKEWNSPARYPVSIKTEKRRAKSRPYWAPFLCCSSINAR